MKLCGTMALSVFLILVVSCSTSKTITGGPISHASLKDGTYDGSARNGPVRVKARITVPV